MIEEEEGGLITSLENFGSAPANAIMGDWLSMDSTYGGEVNRMFTWKNGALYVGYTILSVTIAFSLSVLSKISMEKSAVDDAVKHFIGDGIYLLVYLISRYFLLGRYFLFVGTEIRENEKRFGKILGLVENILNFVFAGMITLAPRTLIRIILCMLGVLVLISLVRTCMFPATKKVGRGAFWALSSPFSMVFVYGLPMSIAFCLSLYS